ncbi:MAG: glycerate kinase [Candidatus Bathyarchaeota archaeon]|nr:glycerate kinase [Candidatus Bathyarchaeota archaeon]
MFQIANQNQLVKNGETPTLQKARDIVLKSFQCALNAIDPKTLLRSRLSLKNSTLSVEDFSFDLSRFEHVYVVGGGKASGLMAQALEDLIGNYITTGFVNIPYGEKPQTQIITLNQTRHPTPDQAGINGTQQMERLVEKSTQNDLIICLISGGGSSLMPLPADSITLKEKCALTTAMLRSGATINEINSIRKHTSAFKGGWFAKKAYPATVLNLILSDVVGDPLDVIASGPTVPDPTTFSDAKNILDKYALWDYTPLSVRQFLLDGIAGAVAETPKPGDKSFERVHNVVVGNNRLASLAVIDCLKSEGLNTLLLSSTLEGEARHVGTMLASVAREVDLSGNPVPRPAGIVLGGETTVTVKGEGKGGRNQELALAAALKLQNIKNCVVASLCTDGVDGPTDVAGAIVDENTLQKAQKQGLNAQDLLADNDSYPFFEKLQDQIFTGATGTNVNDISVIVLL